MNSAKNTEKSLKKSRSGSTRLEDELAYQLDLAKIEYEREFQAIEGRRFRWDFCFPVDSWMVGLPSSPILLEVQGAIFVKGGHSTGTGIMRDHEKNNLAVVNGYRVLYANGPTIKSGEALRWVQEAVKK